jgi:hypothetical protein
VDQAFLDLFHEAAKQGAGFVLALIMFVAFLRATREYHQRLEGLNKRLEDLLRERKADREQTLTLMGRIDAHLSRADAFERRALDKVLAEAWNLVGPAKEPER